VTWLRVVWAWLKRIPLGVWAALGVALALLDLYLRGRRLEAELAQAKLHQVVAQAKAGIAKDEGRAEVHLERARQAERRIEEVETARALASTIGAADEKRLSAMGPSEVHAEYMKLLVQKRAELSIEDQLKVGDDLGKITIRAKKHKSPLPYEE
jgi:hypothetical protein